MGDGLHARSLAVGVAATTFAALLLVLPLNSRLDTVKPCGDEPACSVQRYKSLFLSFAALPAPFNGLNRVSVPALVVISLGIGMTLGAAVERGTGSDEERDVV